MFLRNMILLIGVSVVTSSCALWPYKKDFDCPVTEGLKCKSLYEISEMADAGLFGPNAKKQNQQNYGCQSNCQNNSQNNSDASDNKSAPRKFRTKKLAKGNCCAS